MYTTHTHNGIICYCYDVTIVKLHCSAQPLAYAGQAVDYVINLTDESSSHIVTGTICQKGETAPCVHYQK